MFRIRSSGTAAPPCLHDTRPWRRAAVAATISAAALLVACGQGVGQELGSAQYLADSTSPVLVPVDPRFRELWFFFVEDSPDNYTFRSNWQLSPGRSAGPDDVTGYLVHDLAAWKGGGEHGNAVVEGRLTPRDAFIAAISDSAEPSGSARCELAEAKPQVMRCEYEIWENEAPFGIFVRRFDSTSTVMAVTDYLPSSLEYIAGEFDDVPLSEAKEKWHESRDFS